MDAYAPNITSGTSLTEDLILDLYRWIEHLLAEKSRVMLNPHHYGLTLSLDDKPSLELQKIGPTIHLKRCVGVTSKGGMIAILGGTTPSLKHTMEEKKLIKTKTYMVFVQIHASKRTPFGPESIDLPHRRLYSLPTYQLRVQSSEIIMHSTSNSLPLGRLEWKDEKWQLGTYIPPCMHLGADALLYRKYLKYLGDIKQILHFQPKVLYQTIGMENRALLELREFTLLTGHWLASQQTKLEYLSQWGAPHKLIQCLISFANQTSFHLANLSDRPQFYNLLHENIRGMNGVWFTPDRLLKAVHELSQFRYHHHDIQKVLKLIDQFLDIIVPIFKALATATLHSQAVNDTKLLIKNENSPGTSTW